MTRSTWRRESRRVIDEVRVQHPDASLAELIVLLRRAYPFAYRGGHAYKSWLLEIAIMKRDFRQAIGFKGPLFKRCPACGAAIGQYCKPLGDDDIAAARLVSADAEEAGRFADAAVILNTQAIHEARRQ